MWFLFRLTSHIRCPDLFLIDDIKGSASNVVRDGVKANGYGVSILRHKTN